MDGREAGHLEDDLRREIDDAIRDNEFYKLCLISLNVGFQCGHYIMMRSRADGKEETESLGNRPRDKDNSWHALREAVWEAAREKGIIVTKRSLSTKNHLISMCVNNDVMFDFTPYVKSPGDHLTVGMTKDKKKPARQRSVEEKHNDLVQQAARVRKADCDERTVAERTDVFGRFLSFLSNANLSDEEVATEIRKFRTSNGWSRRKYDQEKEKRDLLDQKREERIHLKHTSDSYRARKNRERQTYAADRRLIAGLAVRAAAAAAAPAGAGLDIDETNALLNDSAPVVDRRPRSNRRPRRPRVPPPIDIAAPLEAAADNDEFAWPG